MLTNQPFLLNNNNNFKIWVYQISLVTQRVFLYEKKRKQQQLL
jgi:hypothetical protein